MQPCAFRETVTLLKPPTAKCRCIRPLKNAHSERFSSKGDCRPNCQNPGLFLASRVITCPSASRQKRCFLPFNPAPFRNAIPDGAFRLNLGTPVRQRGCVRTSVPAVHCDFVKMLHVKRGHDTPAGSDEAIFPSRRRPSETALLYCLGTPKPRSANRAIRQRCAMRDEFASTTFLTIAIFGVVLLCAGLMSLFSI
jgi:hypothetical protein